MKKLTILGSTGSIGVNTLDVVRQNLDDFEIYALAAGRNIELLYRQVLEFRPKVVVPGTSDGVLRLSRLLADSGLSRDQWPEMLSGSDGRVEVSTAAEVDVLVSAIVGVAGLEATYAAVKCGKRVGLANKEVLVSGGELVMSAVRESGCEMLPIDSEHNGAHQCLHAGNRGQVTRLILTASGGPFRNTLKEKLASVTPEQALNHPTWKMGNRITIDSATLMNKGFEVIEAHWLFGFAPSEIDVVVHPQSRVHAMIEYSDGSVIAHVCSTDMRMPIQYALTWPDRRQAPVPKIDWAQAQKWEFDPPDFEKFPLLGLAYDCLRTGGSASCTLNAADEVAVEAFLNRQVGFNQIAEVVEETLQRIPNRQPRTVGDILEMDEESRSVARQLVNQTVPVRV